MARLSDENPELLDEIFTPAERRYSEARGRPAQHLAARFAAKEAVFKALGIGLGVGMNWNAVEIVTPPFGGAPRVRLQGAAAELSVTAGLTELEVSMSHVAGVAMATALAVWAHQEEPDAVPPSRSD